MVEQEWEAPQGNEYEVEDVYVLIMIVYTTQYGTDYIPNKQDWTSDWLFLNCLRLQV